MRRFSAAWHAYAISTRRIVTRGADYFALAPAKAGWRAELAGMAEPNDWATFARHAMSVSEACDLLAYRDAATGQHRFAAFEDGRFIGALFSAREPVAAARDFLAEQLGRALPRPIG